MQNSGTPRPPNYARSQNYDQRPQAYGNSPQQQNYPQQNYPQQNNYPPQNNYPQQNYPQQNFPSSPQNFGSNLGGSAMPNPVFTGEVPRNAGHEEKHKTSGDFIKSVIYGGLDGIVSVFVTVAAASGTQTSILVALFLGLAKLFAGAISMGIGDFLASGAELDVAVREKQREEWEVDNYLEGEVEEMVQLYIQKGVPENNARRIMQILSSNRKAFVSIMMAEELGIPPDALDDKPWKHGLVNFASFMAFGIVPLLIFMISIGVGLSGIQTFALSIIVTATTLYLMGLMQGVLTGANKIKSAFLTLGLGGITAAVGWFVGYILAYAFPGVAIPQ